MIKTIELLKKYNENSQDRPMVYLKTYASGIFYIEDYEGKPVFETINIEELHAFLTPPKIITTTREELIKALDLSWEDTKTILDFGQVPHIIDVILKNLKTKL